MRKFALLTASLLLSVFAFSQNIYIRYDPSCMDKYEYRFVENANNISYNSYKVPNINGDQVFLETGLESPVVRKKVTTDMVECRNMTLDKGTVAALNSGNIKAYLCKKLDSGWAILPISSASLMKNQGNQLTYISPNYELQASLGEYGSDYNVAMKYSDKEASAAMFYLGDIPACNSKAYMFRVSPCQICRIEADVTMHPQLGLIREKEINGQTFELVSINDTPVCEFLTPSPSTIANSEPQPEPQSIPSVEDESVAPATVSSKAVEEPVQKPCGIYAMEGEHLVSDGESLYGLARRYGVSVNNLRSWNEMTTDVIYPCSLLKVVSPPKAEKPSMTEARTNDVPMAYKKSVVKKTIDCTEQAGEGEHVVKQGEGLYAIARAYNIKIEQLRAWNNLASDIIHPCDKINITAPVVVASKTVKKVAPKSVVIPQTYAVVVKPKKNVAPKKAVVKPKTVVAVKPKTAVQPKAAIVSTKSVATSQKALSVKNGIGLHIVKEGETVALLADRFELSDSEFRKINNLSAGERLNVGQVVKTQNCACSVPDDLPKTYSSVVVKKATVTSKGGSEIVMPQPIKVREPEVSSKDGEDKRRKYHVVQSNETLFSIARMYGTTVSKLREANQLGETENITREQLLILDK